MRPLVVTLAFAAVVLVAVNLLSDERNHAAPSPTSRATRTTPLRHVPSPRLTEQQINHQDPPDRQRQRREARAFDRRPLLSALPTIWQGVRFEIGGLADDARTTIVVADAQGRGRRRAQIAWRTLLRRTGDRSDSYRLRIQA
jgi:hypothetical protein